MRQDQEPVRKSGMDDADLARRCDEICGSLEDDLTELGVKNIDTSQIAALRQQRKDFDDLPDDGELKAAQEGKRTKRDAARADLELAISQVAGCAADEWGDQSPQYARFGAKGMDEMDDPTLLRAAQRTHRAGTALLDALAGQGLTKAMVDEVPTKNELFRTALDGFDDAVHARALGARTRVLAHNALYDALSGPAKRAQRFYKPRNATKHSQYVLDAEPGRPAGGGASPTPPTT